VGRFFPDLATRTHVIYNGLDFDTFQPTTTNDIRQHIPNVNPNEHAIVLYPHRPEREKGILEVIETANLLVHEHGIQNLRVLVPRWIESALSPADKAFYDDVTGRIEGYGLQNNFVFHAWVSQTLMPQYYSLGAVTFAIGSYVETFGNVPYESLACGTPSIVARVGPARELLPEDLIEKVDFGDVKSAAAIAARIIKNKERTQPKTIDYLKTHFQREHMVEAYADVILNAAKRQPMPYVHQPLPENTRFEQAPWVYTANGRQYHDFYETYRPVEDIAQDDVMNLYRDGWVVPKN
jgi:glycosyltransferase involved in cell wall biosynthesis